MLYLNFPCLNE